MKFDTQTLIEKLSYVTTLLRQHAAILCFIVFAIIYAVIITTASKISQQAPADAAIKKELKAVARPKVDQKVAETMLGLEERNVTIQSLFENARNNPFTE